MKKVAIIMGSDSDWPVVKGACTVNAAYLAVAILAVADDELAAKLDSFRADTAAAIAKKDAAIAAEAAAL